MIETDVIAAHVCRAIEHARLDEHPFQHLVVDGLLSPEVFAALVAALPETGRYERPERALVSPAHGERAILSARSALPDDLRGILAPLDAALRSAAVVRGLLAKLGGARAERRSDQTPVAQVFLARDVPPYAIGPHTDVPARLASGVLYLSPSDAPAEWGTTLFVPENGAFECRLGRHYSFAGFKPGRTVPFVPNRAVVFRRSDRSFHGLQAMTADPRSRDVLLFEIVPAGRVSAR